MGKREREGERERKRERQRERERERERERGREGEGEGVYVCEYLTTVMIVVLRSVSLCVTLKNFFAYTANSCTPDLLNASYKLKKINHCVCAPVCVCGVSMRSSAVALLTGMCVCVCLVRERAGGVKSSGWLF